MRQHHQGSVISPISWLIVYYDFTIWFGLAQVGSPGFSLLAGVAHEGEAAAGTAIDIPWSAMNPMAALGAANVPGASS